MFALLRTNVKTLIHGRERDSLAQSGDFTDSEFLRLARSVPEVQDFHQARSFMNLVDQYRGVHQSPHGRAFAGDGAHSGESLEQIDVIEQGGAETGRSFVIVFGDVADDIGKVV